MIPILDLATEYQQLKLPIQEAILEVLESGSFVLGNKGLELEKTIAEYLGTSYALGVANGTDALVLALEALGIGPGDEVITTPFTFFATGEAIIRVGARPVFVDIDPTTYNMDPSHIEAAITPITKAILVVHLFGQVAQMDPILELSKTYNLRIIEDACQAIGASYQGQYAGSFGDVGCFSFFPTKNLGAYGDAGMVVTNNQALYEKMLALRNHGSYVKYVHPYIGYNSRLDEIQAAILLVKFPYLETWNQRRKQLAETYSQRLSTWVQTPHVAKGRDHIFHQYCIETPARDSLQSFLHSRQIATGIYYPIPLHLQNPLQHFGYSIGSMPVAERTSKTILALPIYPMMTDQQQETVIESILEWAGDQTCKKSK